MLLRRPCLYETNRIWKQKANYLLFGPRSIYIYIYIIWNSDEKWCIKRQQPPWEAESAKKQVYRTVNRALLLSEMTHSLCSMRRAYSMGPSSWCIETVNPRPSFARLNVQVDTDDWARIEDVVVFSQQSGDIQIPVQYATRVADCFSSSMYAPAQNKTNIMIFLCARLQSENMAKHERPRPIRERAQHYEIFIPVALPFACKSTVLTSVTNVRFRNR